MTTRRERQIVEITALVASGNVARAEGLAREHSAEFPDDADRLATVVASGVGGDSEPGSLTPQR